MHSHIIRSDFLSEKEKYEMYGLMDEFYNNIDYPIFLKDLTEKDYVILLRNEKKLIKGFSTQKIIKLPVHGCDIFGVFSGDTIIHKENWGSPELFKAFARFFIKFGEQFDHFYWFLISKGYKTYKMLPLFFKEFYPDYRSHTPPGEKAIMDAFGVGKYLEEYHKESGVIRYKNIKDYLKTGVADITEKELKDPHISFFVEKNPNYIAGDDLMCLARLEADNLTKIGKKLLIRQHNHDE